MNCFHRVRFPGLIMAVAASFGLTATAFAAEPTPDQTLANFSATCKDVQLNGSILKASCQTYAGNFSLSSIDLQPLVANHDSQLEWELDQSNVGNYTATTSNCRLTPVNAIPGKYQFHALECDARHANGSQGHSSLLLDLYIENKNGQLTLRTDPHYPPCGSVAEGLL